jgi:hypothetical protein
MWPADECAQWTRSCSAAWVGRCSLSWHCNCCRNSWDRRPKSGSV